MFWNDSKPSTATPPLPNTYWVQPGRLLAGEYPSSMSRAEAMERVQSLLRAGVTSFIDLTEEGELPEYDHLLPDLTEQRIRYRRLPVLDHGVPDSSAHMAQIVDAIEDELAAGRCVYVHCRAGIGRTGMAVACHLIRGGLSNQDALDHLQTLWRRCERSRSWPSVPETEAQAEFVRKWRDSTRAPASSEVGLQSRYEGALVGLAFGDALGALVSAAGFDAAALSDGPHGLRTSVHTGTARVLAESLLTLGKHDASDQMQRYMQWMRTAPQASVPADFRRALAAWQWSKKPNAGSHDPKNLDSHSLPRTVVCALYLRSDPLRAQDLAADASRTTQQAPIVLELCRIWAAQFIDALNGASKETLIAYEGPALRVVRQRTLKPRVKALLDGTARAQTDPDDALSVTQAAVRSFAATNTFRDALLSIATSRTPPSAAALCGALSGAHYGVESIPLDWRKRITEDAALRSLAHHLLG
jgi:protein-tyrosine phosphatase/ADP-ribosylglycohydrolase